MMNDGVLIKDISIPQ